MTLAERILERRTALGISQAELGRRVGVTQQAIMGLEQGRVQSSRNLVQLARELGVTPDWLMTGAPDNNVTAFATPPHPAADVDFRSLPKDVPVLGNAVGGDDGDFEFNGQTIDYIRRPPGIATLKDVFGLYVAGTSMYPRFEEGEPVYLSSARPPALGDYVVLELLPEREGDPSKGFIKRLARRTPTKIVVEQFNPPRELEFSRDRIKAIFRIIPMAELVGL